MPEQIAQSFEISKKNLGVSYLDGWILHSPLENIDQKIIAWKSMEQILKKGGTKLLGISNCYHLETLKQLQKEAIIKPAILQNRFYQDTGYDKAIRKWCQENQVIYQSFWTLTANPQILNSAPMQKIAQIVQKTPAQIFFHVLIDIGLVPLTGTCSDKHMKEDLEIYQFELPENAKKEILSLLDS